MTRASCPFCDRASLSILCENDLAFAIHDKHPVRPLHSLILPKRHAFDVFDTTLDERECMHRLAETLRGDIMRADPSVRGFNFGSNIGAAAGQKIFHAHLHLIPRRAGDTPPPPAPGLTRRQIGKDHARRFPLPFWRQAWRSGLSSP